MKVKYLGPNDYCDVAPHGRHFKGKTEEYPDDFAKELVATSKRQKFKAVGQPKSETKKK